MINLIDQTYHLLENHLIIIFIYSLFLDNTHNNKISELYEKVQITISYTNILEYLSLGDELGLFILKFSMSKSSRSDKFSRLSAHLKRAFKIYRTEWTCFTDYLQATDNVKGHLFRFATIFIEARSQQIKHSVNVHNSILGAQFFWPFDIHILLFSIFIKRQMTHDKL